MPSKLSRAISSSLSQSEDAGAEEQLTDLADSSASNGLLNGDSHTPTNEEQGSNVQFGLSNEEHQLYSRSNKSGSMNSLQEVYKMEIKPGEAVPSTLLPPIDQPVPGDWVTLEGEFVSVCATYQTHMGSDVIMAPEARFSDGIIHLCMVKSGIQKTDLLNLMSMLEKGTHIDYPSPHFEMVKVLAFRLEPVGTDGIIMVDGERVEFGPLQAQVLPQLANLMAIQ